MTHLEAVVGRGGPGRDRGVREERQIDGPVPPRSLPAQTTPGFRARVVCPKLEREKRSLPPRLSWDGSRGRGGGPASYHEEHHADKVRRTCARRQVPKYISCRRTVTGSRPFRAVCSGPSTVANARAEQASWPRGNAPSTFRSHLRDQPPATNSQPTGGVSLTIEPSVQRTAQRLPGLPRRALGLRRARRACGCVLLRICVDQGGAGAEDREGQAFVRRAGIPRVRPVHDGDRSRFRTGLGGECDHGAEPLAGLHLDRHVARQPATRQSDGRAVRRDQRMDPVRQR